MSPEAKRRWRCLECGATGTALTYRQRRLDLYQHWLDAHQEVDF